VEAKTRPVTLHLVRHGETAWNAERRFQTPDVPLNDAGRAQAAEVALKLAGALAARRDGDVALLSSDYARTLAGC
jgi:probable phosphoglycerate mutase